MIYRGETNCPKCGGNLKYYDKVKRIVRSRERKTKRIKIRRLRCCDCDALHRELPNFLFPFKQYEAEIIYAVLEETITPNTIGYENYPCEMTMIRWKKQANYILSQALKRLNKFQLFPHVSFLQTGSC